MSMSHESVPETPVRRWRKNQVTTRELLAPYGLRLGINPLGWTNDVITEFGDDTPVETFIAEAAACGYQGLEMGRNFPIELAAVGRLLPEGTADLVSGWYSSWPGDLSVAEELDNVANHARVLAENGARILFYGEIGLMPGDHPLLSEFRLRCAQPADTRSHP